MALHKQRHRALREHAIRAAQARGIHLCLTAHAFGDRFATSVPLFQKTVTYISPRPIEEHAQEWDFYSKNIDQLLLALQEDPSLWRGRSSPAVGMRRIVPPASPAASDGHIPPSGEGMYGEEESAEVDLREPGTWPTENLNHVFIAKCVSHIEQLVLALPEFKGEDAANFSPDFFDECLALLRDHIVEDMFLDESKAFHDEAKRKLRERFKGLRAQALVEEDRERSMLDHRASRPERRPRYQPREEDIPDWTQRDIPS